MVTFFPFLFQPSVDIRELSNFLPVSFILTMLHIIDGVLFPRFPLSPFHPFLTRSSWWEGAPRQGESELQTRLEGGGCPNLVAGIHKLSHQA